MQPGKAEEHAKKLNETINSFIQKIKDETKEHVPFNLKAHAENDHISIGTGAHIPNKLKELCIP